MVNVVEQKKKFKLDGDFTSYNLDKFSKYFVGVKKNHRSNSLSLSYLSINAMNRLEHIIDEEFTKKLFKAGYVGEDTRFEVLKYNDHTFVDINDVFGGE